jgi:hypothetical protein
LKPPLHIVFEDDGSFTVKLGQMSTPPAGWKEVSPGHWEPQWPACTNRGLSTRVKGDRPVIAVHCSQLRSVVDCPTCQACLVVRPPAPPMTRERLEQEMAALEAKGAQTQPIFPDTDEEAPPLEAPDAQWPACAHRTMVEAGCCPKLECQCPDHAQEGKALRRKVCLACKDATG